MPRPVERGQRYMPGLDGLRALAVLAVLAYHLDLGWASGGLLGVGVFFTLSGFLITDLLLEEWVKGGVNLGRFWLRRARRLLPALFVILVVVAAWVTLLRPAELESLRGAVASAATYVNNWWQIFSDVPYVDRFGPPSPLGHLWSLAVEEQFYLVWPFVLLAGLRFLREPGRRARVRPRLATATLVLAAASAVLMAVLFTPGFDSTRVYDGTDTRAFGLLIGAALAMVWPARRLGGAITANARRDPRRGRARRPGGDRGADLAHRLLLAVPLPVRPPAPVRGDRARDREPRPPGDAAREGLRLGGRSGGSACARTGSTSGTSR